MKLLDRFAKRFGYVTAADAEYESWKPDEAKIATGRAYSTTDHELGSWFGGQTYAGRSVDANTSLQFITVFICNRIISETLGLLHDSIGVFERDRFRNYIEVEHDLASILSMTPNSDMDGVEFLEAKGSNLALQGNSYSYINRRGGGAVSSLYPIATNDCEPKRRSDGTIYYRVRDRGKWIDMPRENIWHVKGFGGDGLVGYSPIGYARQLIGMGLATEEFQARFFSNGAMPSWIISIPQWLEEDQRPKARANIQELMAGINNAYRVMFLEGGITATPATMPLEDAQFLQLRGFNRDEIFGLFRVPPHMGGNLERSTNNNIEHQALEFVQYCMMPYITRIEASARRWLLPPGERSRLVLRFNVDELLRADAKTLADLHSKYVQNAILTRNEVRAAIGRNRVPVEGMDDLTAQTNLAPITMLSAIAERLSQRPSGGNQPPQPSQQPAGEGEE